MGAAEKGYGRHPRTIRTEIVRFMPLKRRLFDVKDIFQVLERRFAETGA